MMKKEYVYMNFLINGHMEEYEIERKDFEAVIKEAETKGLDEIMITLEGKQGEIANIPLKVEVAKQIARVSNLVKKDIVPKKLECCLIDLTKMLCIKQRASIKGRENEIKKAWFYLSQPTRNNVCFTGPTEVGKTAVAFELARQIVSGECPKEFSNKRLIMIDPEIFLRLESLDETKHKEKYRNILNKTIEFIQKNRKNIVLFIDNAIFMFFEECLYSILDDIMTEYNIPTILTVNEEHYEGLFRENFIFEKYVNEVYIEEPEFEEVFNMIKGHAAGLKRKYGISISEDMIKFAMYTSDLSSSTSANPGKTIKVLKNAFNSARLMDKTEVDKESIMACYNIDKKWYSKMTEKAKRDTAYHEIGHYIATTMLEHSKNKVKVAFVSIIPAEYYLGVNSLYFNREDDAVPSKEYYIDAIAVDLAGRVAETRVTKAFTSGAYGDLENANHVAREASMRCGLSEENGNHNRHYDYEDYYLLPESKKEQLDNERQKWIDKGFERAEKIISENEELLKLLSEKMMVEGILTGEELKKICKDYKKNKEVDEK